jgi:dihydrofolate reductase
MHLILEKYLQALYLFVRLPWLPYHHNLSTMRKLVLFMHASLDGFVAGLNGEMNWIHVDEEIFDYVAEYTDKADTALYGRATYEMMDSYWPTAADKPNASKHDIHHSNWYKHVNKVVISETMRGQDKERTRIIGEDLPAQISELKQQQGSNIIMFGSPGAAHSLMKDNLIDEYWLFINPILLEWGIPLFKNARSKLKLISHTAFSSGVICLHYGVAGS